MRTPGDILLLSCYELGHQPLNLASPLAVLAQAGYSPVAVDTSVESLTDEAIHRAKLVCISVPMHTALRLAMRVAERVRQVNPAARLCFYGLYASLNADYLFQKGINYIISGEYEQALLGLAQAIEAGAGKITAIPGVSTPAQMAAPILSRLPFQQPERRALPPLEHYARLQQGCRLKLAGYVEASRGCLHTCLHCPITPVYGGRFFVIPREIVLQDIRAQVQMGAVEREVRAAGESAGTRWQPASDQRERECGNPVPARAAPRSGPQAPAAEGAQHITFGDPDFLNGPGHSLNILRAMHAEFPHLTFDATIKIEHILERRSLFAEFKALGCAFIVSAVESVSDHVLTYLDKGHTRADIIEALAILNDAGIPMRPSLLPFTPWTSLDDYLDLLYFVEEHDLIEQIDPVHYSIRLLLPPGSALLEQPYTRPYLTTLDPASFSYSWVHPDPRMDQLQRTVAALAEAGERSGSAPTETFAAILALAEEAAGLSVTAVPQASPPIANKATPHLTESWFC